jgi:hypothetical protein
MMQFDPALLDSGPIPCRSLANHHLRVVDPKDETFGRPTGKFADREAGTEANLQDLIARLHLEKSNDPSVPFPIGRTQRHLPTSQTARKAMRSNELRKHHLEQSVFKSHRSDSATSSPLEVKWRCRKSAELTVFQSKAALIVE